MIKISIIQRLVYWIEMLLLMALIVPSVNAQDTSTQLLYAASVADTASTIYKFDAASGAKTEVGSVHNLGSQAGWSPRGGFIYLLDYADPLNPMMRLIDTASGFQQILSDKLLADRCSIPFDWSPDDQWIAYTEQAKPHPIRRLLNLTSGRLLALQDADLNYAEMFWASSGRYLAYYSVSQSGKEALTILDLQSQQSNIVMDVDTAHLPEWSSVENRIAFLGTNPIRIQIYNALDNTIQHFDTSNLGSWSPDGKYLTAFYPDTNFTRLTLFDVSANKPLELSGDLADADVDTRTAWSFDGHYLALRIRIPGNPAKDTAGILDVENKSLQTTDIQLEGYEPFVWSRLTNRLIMISGNQESGDDGFTSLWMLDVDRAQSWQYDVKIPMIPDAPKFNPSPNGNDVLFPNNAGLALFNFETGQITPIDTETKFWRPNWSSDGRWIATTSNMDIMMLHLGGNTVTNITNTPDMLETFLGWRGANNRNFINSCGEG